MLEFLVALIATGAVMVPVVALLRRHDVADIPNARSSHVVAVPRGGGIGVLLGVAAGVLASLVAGAGPGSAVPSWTAAVVATGVLLFAALGLVDDLRRLPAVVRLALQVVLSAAVAVSVAVGVSSPWAAGVIAVIGTIWLVSYVNAFNFMDGVNAISAMSALLAACWYGGLAAHDAEPFVFAAAWALAGASLGYLPWNAVRPRVFLGDVGSYGIGALVGVLALLTALREHSVWLAIAPLVVYLVDTSGTLIRRAVRHEPLMTAHRSHVYQRLLDVGLSHLGSTAVVIAAGALICGATLALDTAPAILVAVVVAAGYLSLPHLLRSRRSGVAA